MELSGISCILPYLLMGNKQEKPKTNMDRIPRPLFKSFSHVGRRWCKKSLPEHINKTKSTNFEFTVATYNVLADQLMKDNPYLYYEGMARNPVVFEWEYRKHNLLKEIVHANPDILCLQEVQEEHYYNWFNPQLQQRGYTGAYKKRLGDKIDGCATFFKHDLFKVEFCHTIDYYRENVPLMDRGNVAILLFLTPRKHKMETGVSFCIANTHLLYNERRGDIKLTQLAHLFAEIDMFSKLHASNPHPTSTILCGDFNSVPYSPLYKLVVDGYMKYEGMSRYLVSGQHGESGPGHTEFGEILFPSDIGLSNHCRWTHLDDAVMLNATMQSDDAFTVNGTMDDSSNDSLCNLIGITRKSLRSNARVRKDKLKWKNPSITDKETILEGNRKMPDILGCLRHDLSLHSSYSHFTLDGIPEISTCHDRGAVMVDYIFYDPMSCHEGQKRLFLSGILELLHEDVLNEMGKLPNEFLSSDHLLLKVAFVVQ